MKLNVYIHIPFCLKKCGYCDFFSVPDEKKSRLSFLKSLKKEIILRGRQLKNPKIKTLYFGGGTPSILTPTDFTKITGWLRKTFHFSKNIEFSLEANPETITKGKIHAWRRAGVNRISLGIQTFSDKFLKILGRVHTSKKSIAAIKLVKKYFRNFNVDLMFGLPGQTIKEFEKDLKKVVSFRPAHISVYQLTLEPGTPLSRTRRQMPGDETLFKMYRLAINYLKKSGYRHYEISNFARPGHQCRHNLGIWHFEPYLGLGPGAHSFIENRRFANQPDFKKSTASFPKHKISKNQLMSEFMFLGLRCTDGIKLKNFKKLFGVKLTKIYNKQIKKLKKQKLIKIAGNKIRLTKKGVFLGNEVFSEFI